MQYKGKSQNDSSVFVMMWLTDVLLFSQHASWKPVLLLIISEGFFPSKEDSIKDGVTLGVIHIAHLLCCHRMNEWMDGCGSFWQAHRQYLGQKDTHTEIHAVHYSLAFNKMVFAFNFSHFGIRLIKGFPEICFKIYQWGGGVPYGPLFFLFFCALIVSRNYWLVQRRMIRKAEPFDLFRHGPWWKCERTKLYSQNWRPDSE